MSEFTEGISDRYNHVQIESMNLSSVQDVCQKQLNSW